MRFLTAGVALTLVATSASADTNVERLKQLSLAMNEKMTETIVLKVPEARDHIPTVKWNDAIETAARCTMDAYEDRLGSDGIDTLLSNMEALVARTGLSFEEFSEEATKMSPLSIEEQSAVEKSCGMGKAMSSAMMSDPKFAKFSQFMMKAMSDQ